MLLIEIFFGIPWSTPMLNIEICHFVLNLGLIFYSFLLGVCDGEVLGLCDGTSDGEIEGIWDGAVPQIYFCIHIG